MSTIPTRQIDGDAAIGRNVSAGGNANIQGNVRVGHDLKVEGWLEAKNIKGPNKGLFGTLEALREAYPCPREGWFAGVSATDADIAALALSVEKGKALFRMYVGNCGEWVREPINKLYEIVVDNTQIETLCIELNELRSQYESLQKRAEEYNVEISTLQQQFDTIERSLSTTAGDLSKRMNAIDVNIGNIQKSTSSLEGEMSVLQKQTETLSASVEDLLEQSAQVCGSFASFSFAMLSMLPPAIIQGSCGQYTSVVWLPAGRVFAALGTDGRYYANWDTAGSYMDDSRTAPRRDRLWRCGSDFYFWDGSELRLLFQQTRHVTLSQEEYDELSDPDPETIYFIPEKEQG